MEKQEFVSHIRYGIQKILNRVFADDYSKQRLKVKYSSINCACPYCNDSATDSTKKRGNFILVGPCSGFYKCFNCGHFTNGIQFFKDFNITLSPEVETYIKELNKNFELSRNPRKNQFDLSAFTGNKKDFNKIDLSLVDLIYDYEEVEKFAVSKQTLYANKKFSIIPLQQSIEAQNYLKSRNQLYPVNFQKFGYIPDKNALVIFNLTLNGNVIGFQYRFLDQNIKNRYRTYKTSRIWNDLLGIEKEVPEKIDKISTMFNIMLVDFNRPIICLEGPLDSMLIPNSIATSSASINPPDILEDYYYMYDSDQAGNKEAIKKLSHGEYVFLWSKLKEDLNLPVQHKWDWNEVHNWLKLHDKKPPTDLLPYFSNNQLDVILN